MFVGRLSRRRRIIGAATALAAGVLFSSHARSTAGDIELGRYLAGECMSCHRSATSTSTIPNIFGVDEAHILGVLKLYRDKSLPNPVMQSIAGRLNDEEMAALAAFFSQTPKPP